jgi:hypothetical protein
MEGRNPALRDWARLGHLNWLLNVLPWGRPALTELYRKMSGKQHSYRSIYINAKVRRDLTWLKDIIPKAIGIRLVDNGLSSDLQAEMVFSSDASPRGAISFVFVGNGFVCQLKEHVDVDILFLELMGVVSAINHATSLPRPPSRVLIWTDSLDSVGLFHSLKSTTSINNAPLLAAASIVLRSGIDVRI